jgi:DNA-binding IclR family transcriptional regulator
MDVTARNPIETTRTTFRILEQLVERDGATVSELARATPFTKGTVHNHLATLRELGYVTKSDTTYHVGLQFLCPAGRAADRTPLANVSTAPIAELAEATGQRVDLVATEDHWGVLVHSECGGKYSGPKGVVGAPVPLHCSAPGKAILAHHEGLSAGDALALAEEVERTDRTITDAARLEEELAHVHEERLAYDRGEHRDDYRGIAVPVAGAETVRGAIGVLGRADDMRGKTFQQDVPGLVISAAERLRTDLRDR